MTPFTASRLAAAVTSLLLICVLEVAVPSPALGAPGPGLKTRCGAWSDLPRAPLAADTLSGRVTSADGKPLAGARVRISELGRSVTTDASGRFEFRGLPEGAYRLVVERLGYESVVRTVRAGAPTGVELSLSPTALPAEPIVVTATGGAVDVRDSPLPVSVVRRDELSPTSSVSLAHTLENLPGVRNLSTGQQVGKPVVRGVAGPRVAVRENGLPLNFLDWSDEDGPAVDARLAETVEVVRGPASVLYGSGAIGGVVNVLPEPLPGAPGAGSSLDGSLEVYGSSSNLEGGGHLELEGASGPFGWRVAGVARSGDNLETPDGELGNTGYEALNGRAAVGLHESWGSVSVRYARHRGDFELLEAGEEPREPLGEQPGRTVLPGARLETDEVRSEDEGPLRDLEDDRIQASADIPLSSDFRLEAKGQFQRHWTAEIPPAGEEGEEEGTGDEELTLSVFPVPGLRPRQGIEEGVEEREEGEEFEFAFRLNTGTGRILVHHGQAENVSATYGVSGRYTDTESRGEIPIIPDGQRGSLGLFALEEVRLDRVRLFAGARFDAEQLDVARSRELDVSARERDFAAWTGSVGASVRVARGLTLSANVGRAWRAPTLLELYSEGPRIGERRFEIGDATLSTESSLNLDGGVRFERGPFRAEVRGYRNEIDDFVFLQPTDEFRGDLRVHLYEQADAHLTGVEASADVEPWQFVELGARFEAVGGRNEETDEDLPQVPPARGDLTAELHRRALEWADRVFLRLEGEAVAEGEAVVESAEGESEPATEAREGETPFGLDTDSYALLHAAAGWEGQLGSRDLRVTLRVRNVTDNDYRRFLSRYKEFALAPGRSLSLRLGTSF